MTEPGRGPVIGPDGQPRCPWGLSTPQYVTYHDDEWGRPVRDDRGIFERLCLEAFQSGLSWLTILRKRENFRAAFGGFAMESVAAYGPDDVARLMADAGIVRNRAKIDAAIRNARAALELPDGLAALIWSYAPVPSVPDSSGDPRRSGGPRMLEDLPAASAESKALARDLKRRGFAFTGPVTVYSTMQACGIVDDHLFGCFRRGAYT